MEIKNIIENPIEKKKLPVYMLYWKYDEEMKKQISKHENVKSFAYNTCTTITHGHNKIIFKTL